jgi:pre-60S factor REI1
MRDASHCRINFERDEIALALAAAAFPLATVPIARGEAEGGAAAQSAYVDQQSTELVLPNGHRLGHRSLKHIYKQSRKDAAGGVLVPHAKSTRQIEAEMALREQAKRRDMVLRRSAGLALHGASKAISSSYTHKADAADNKHARAVVHHWGAGGGGSHYHMAGSRQYQKGNKVKGVVLRHSRQGARLQAERNKANRSNSSSSVLR